MLRYYLPLVGVLLSGAVWASESYHPPEGGGAWQKVTLYLKPTGPFQEASGAVVFACNTAETFHRSYLYAKGVRADALYTIWLVEMDGFKVKRSHQITSKWSKLHADNRGVVSFVTNIPWCPVGKDALVVKYHPNDRKGSFDQGITVLKGYLRTME